MCVFGEDGTPNAVVMALLLSLKRVATLFWWAPVPLTMAQQAEIKLAKSFLEWKDLHRGALYVKCLHIDGCYRRRILGKTVAEA